VAPAPARGAPRRSARRRDRGRAALPAAAGASFGICRHGRLGRRAGRGHRHDERADRRSGPGTRRGVSSSTRTPWWSVPCQDWGPSSAPGCSASSAMRRTGMPPPSVARTTPERHRSPAPLAPGGSCSPATPATSASPTRSTCGPSPLSAPPREPAATTTPARPPATPTALRALGNRLAGILPGCLAHHTPYNETTAWAHRIQTSA